MTNATAQEILAKGKIAGFIVKKRKMYTPAGRTQRFDYVVCDQPHGSNSWWRERTVHKTAEDAIKRVAKHIGITA